MLRRLCYTIENDVFCTFVSDARQALDTHDIRYIFSYDDNKFHHDYVILSFLKCQMKSLLKRNILLLNNLIHASIS